MKKNSLLKSILFTFNIVAIAVIISIFLVKDLKFGLDLQGGFEILYQVDGANGEKVTSDMVTSTYKTIEKRINGLGVSESELIVEGDRIRVQLPGVKDGKTARQTLSAVASLTFRDSSDNLLMTSDVLSSGGAKVSTDEFGKPAVALSIKDKDTFYKVTKKVSQTSDKLLVIWLDYKDTDSYAKELAEKQAAPADEKDKYGCGSTGSRCLSAAKAEQGFASDVIITGSFTEEEVENLVTLINSGSLPTKLTEISSKTVDASFGADSLELTAKAGIIGVGLIMLVMIITYHFAGFISAIGLLIYTFLTLFTFWLFGGVLTLPGIAALVIGIGMAIDSSVITFARIKDELKNNVTLEGAIKKGNKNSFMAIFDSNLTTLLVAFILFIFGESSVKGFATMLIISTIVTMVIMVYLTRSLLNLYVNTGKFDKKLNFFIGYKKKDSKLKVNFIKARKFVYIYLILLILLGVFTFVKNGLTLGIDFKGGSSISVISDNKLEIKDIEKDLKELGYTVYNTEVINDNSVTLKVNESFEESDVLKVDETIIEKYDAKTEIGTVSNIVKKDLVKNAIISVIIACLGIILYVSFRFSFNFAFTGILALVHDVLLMFVVFSVLKLEVSSIFIAAVLSIIGYSINDTIVSFDRIRENLHKKDVIKNKEELQNIVNTSLNSVLTRSIITTITTLCPVVMLIVLGSHEIFNFNIALLIGLLAGVVSSILIASPIWYDLEKLSIGKPKKKKWYEE